MSSSLGVVNNDFFSIEIAILHGWESVAGLGVGYQILTASLAATSDEDAAAES